MTEHKPWIHPLLLVMVAVVVVALASGGTATFARFSDTKTVEMSVNASEEFDTPPIAKIGSIPNETTLGETINLNASQSRDDVGVSTHKWNLGNQGKAKGKEVSHSFDAPGTYTIELVVNDTAGQTDTVTRNVTVKDVTSPSAALSVSDNNVLVDESIEFDATNSSDNHAIASIQWDLGDNTTKTGKSIQHSYSTAGTYTVEITVIDKSGNADTVTTEIQVSEPDDPPNAKIDADSSKVGIGDTVQLSAKNSTDDNGIDSYEWEADNASSATGSTASFSWNDVGSYTVQVTVTDTAGQTDSASTTITVEDQTDPTAKISADSTNVSVNETVGFDASSSDDNVEIESYEWEFGDGATGSGPEVSHTFDSAGTYTVKVIVTDGTGNTDSATVSIEVHS